MTEWTPTPTVAESKPISDSLAKHLDEVLAKIPSGKHVLITGSVTTTGVVGSIGATKSVGRWDLTGTGYAGKVWGGSGWEAGVRATIAR